jgi:nucleotide-binding universal stress UspA family protein
VSTQRIVVGVDGTAGSKEALRWAVHHAADHEGPVVVHAVAVWRMGRSVEGGQRSPIREFRRLGEMLETEIAALPADDRSHVEVTKVVEEGEPEEVLAEHCDGADMLVLGSNRHSKLWHLVFGWTAELCARRVACPVVIIPPHKRARKLFKFAPAAARTPVSR